jgi:ABC-type branched-subunit amino acid transport system substrate-binding protein
MAQNEEAGLRPATDWWKDPLPIRLGWLNDNPPLVENLPVVQFVVERFNKLKRIDRTVELSLVRAQGAPAGRIKNIFKAWLELKEMGCLAIMGPSISDACIEIGELINAEKVPTITSGASAQAIGEWYFDVSWGAIPEEGYIIANWLVREGHKRVGVCWDTAYHAGEYLRHFRAAARRAKIEICGEYRINQLDMGEATEDANRALASLRKSNIDAIVHLGTGSSAHHLAGAWQVSDWKPPLIINDAYYGSAMPQNAPTFEGVVGICGFDEENPVFATAYREFTEWAGKPPQHPEMFAVWYTLASAALEGIANAPILSTDGVRRGLESVTLMPSAIGGPRAAVSFSPWNHRGSGGADVYVLRKIVGGKSVMEMRYDPMRAKLI